MKACTLAASTLVFVLVATFARPARADWTGHLDAAGGSSSAHGGSGELVVRLDSVVISFADGHAGVGPAAETHVLTPRLGAGLVGVWRDGMTAMTTTLVYGYDAGDDRGAYLAGTVAYGFRVTDFRTSGWVPSSAAYVSINQKLDGSDNQIVFGLQLGLGFTYAMLGAFAH